MAQIICFKTLHLSHKFGLKQKINTVFNINRVAIIYRYVQVLLLLSKMHISTHHKTRKNIIIYDKLMAVQRH